MALPVSPQDPWVQIAEILRLIRSGAAQTRPELADATRLGRNVITLRVQAASDLGLVQPSGDARSRGGRAADVWEFTGHATHLLVAIQGLTSFRVVLADLGLHIIETRRVAWSLTADPVETCERMAAELEALLRAHPEATAWAMGLGLQAPVNFDTGQSTDPVTSVAQFPRWPRDFNVRKWFVERLGVPVWVESVSNLSALGAAAAPGAPADLVFVRLAKGVGSGIVSDGKLHRGADWVAGEITHITVQDDHERICMCGRVGCLDAFAGEWAVEADARRAVAEGRSPSLARLDPAAITVDDVVAGADAGDVACVEILLRAADALGRVLAGVVTWFNPRRVVVGGNALASSSMFFSAMRRTLTARALAASVEHLEVLVSDRDRDEEVLGALVMVQDLLLSPAFLAAWGPLGSPLLVEDLRTRESQL
ncbi:MAG TPA: ROK family protein [Propionibacteriaceae bacterium]|nr:ROK family protein [Propionibacteriaceae bacterium]